LVVQPTDERMSRNAWNRREPTIELNEEQAIEVAKLNATMNLSLQQRQLLT